MGETEFSQLLQNLVSNAIKYGKERGKIQIKVSEADAEHMLVAISDNGEGIAPDKLQSIFEPMNRGGRFDNLGHGLGLATCQKIARGHGGEIWCESRPGSGSTFFVKLPA